MSLRRCSFLPASLNSYLFLFLFLIPISYCQQTNDTQDADTCPPDNGANNTTSTNGTLGTSNTQPSAMPNPFLNALDVEPYEAKFNPSASFKDTLENNTAVPGAYSALLGCVCNITYVSYACCDAPNGIVYEDPTAKLGSLSELHSNSTQNSSQQELLHGSQSNNAVTPSISSPTDSSSDTSSTNHICSGYCYSSARQCSWAHTGDCYCAAPKIGILFWASKPCYPTEKNPNKQHDKRMLTHSGPGKGPIYTPDREPGVCNSSYISYACADAKDGTVHEPLSNWLGALLPPGSSDYPPIPQEFLDVHGIEEQPVLGAVDLPYWPKS